MPAFVREVRGLHETQRKLEQVIADLQGDEMTENMRAAVLILERGVKVLAPVDTGRMRASIVPAVEQRFGKIVGRVGTPVEYAPHVEFGTRPHMPPVAALQTWARRHGMNAYVLARAIARRGTRGRFFFKRALETHHDRVVQLVGDGVARIVTR